MKISWLAIVVALGRVRAHGGHDEVKQRPSNLNWQSWHMIEEHQLDQFDADSFFKLHDVQNKGYWEPSDVLYIYGLNRDSNVGDGSGMGQHSGHESIGQKSKDEVVSTIFGLLDYDGDGKITVDEWKKFNDEGKELPDVGYGQGHHFDFESEYEEHHWNEYHRDQDPDVHIKHKEDIEHELLHHEHEIEQTHDIAPEVRLISNRLKSNINLDNVPLKYRKS